MLCLDLGQETNGPGQIRSSLVQNLCCLTGIAHRSCTEICSVLFVTQLRERSIIVMATSSYTAEFGAGVVVNGLDLNSDATKVLVGGRKGRL